MIKHIVMWKLQTFDNLADKRQVANNIKEKLEALLGNIPQIIDLQVGINIDNPHANFDVILNSTFHSMGDLAAYQTHPDHITAGRYIKSVVVDRACVDYSAE